MKPKKTVRMSLNAFSVLGKVISHMRPFPTTEKSTITTVRGPDEHRATGLPGWRRPKHQPLFFFKRDLLVFQAALLVKPDGVKPKRLTQEAVKAKVPHSTSLQGTRHHGGQLQLPALPRCVRCAQQVFQEGCLPGSILL